MTSAAISASPLGVSRARATLAPRCALVALLAALACSGAGPGWSVDRRGDDEVTSDGLWPVRYGGFQRVWLAPDERFAGYTKLWIAPPRVYYRRQPTARDSAIVARGVHSDSPNVPLTPQQQQDFYRYLVEAFTRELAESRYFELVDAPGEGTLVVAPDIHDLVLLVPLAPEPGGRFVGTTATAQMTLLLELRDGVSQRTLGRIAEWRQAVPPGNAGAYDAHESLPVQNVSALRHTFSEWAWQLRVRLDGTRARATKLRGSSPS